MEQCAKNGRREWATPDGPRRRAAFQKTESTARLSGTVTGVLFPTAPVHGCKHSTS